jgi:hypothetical protein
MRRSLIFSAAMCAVLLVTATTRSDVGTTTADTASLPEPISGTAVEAAPSDQPPLKDPFAAYDVGSPESIWPYDSLTHEEQRVIDRGRDVTGWQQTHADYATAVRERSRDALAGVAQHALGIDSSFEYTGVMQ